MSSEVILYVVFAAIGWAIRHWGLMGPAASPLTPAAPVDPMASILWQKLEAQGLQMLHDVLDQAVAKVVAPAAAPVTAPK